MKKIISYFILFGELVRRLSFAIGILVYVFLNLIAIVVISSLLWLEISPWCGVIIGLALCIVAIFMFRSYINRTKWYRQKARRDAETERQSLRFDIPIYKNDTTHE